MSESEFGDMSDEKFAKVQLGVRMLPHLKVGESPSSARSAALSHMDDDRAELAAESVEAVDASASTPTQDKTAATVAGSGSGHSEGDAELSALSPDHEVVERAEAALTADDVSRLYRSEQNPAEYVRDTYGVDPRECDDEYEVRSALAEAEADPQPVQARQLDEDREASGEGLSTSMSTLSVDERVDVDHSALTAAQYIREEYSGVDPSEYNDADVLRAALREQR